MKKQKNKKMDADSRKMFLGLFLLFPILFFGNQLGSGLLFNLFGILALIGAGIEIFYFIKILRVRKK